VVSWNCSWATSGGWSFFSVLGLVLQAGELVDQGDELFGQRLEAPVIIHVVLDLRGLVRRHALGELFTAQEALQDVIRAARDGVRLGFEELFAQAAAAEAVDGLHLLEDGLPLLNKVIKIMLHGQSVSLQIHSAITKCLTPLLFCFGLLSGHTPGAFTDPISLGGTFPIIATAVIKIPACMFPQIN